MQAWRRLLYILYASELLNNNGSHTNPLESMMSNIEIFMKNKYPGNYKVIMGRDLSDPLSDDDQNATITLQFSTPEEETVFKLRYE